MADAQTRAGDEDEAVRAAARALGSGAPLLDAMFEGVQVLGTDWTYRYINPAAAAHGRSTPAALLGRRITDCYPGIEHTEMFGRLCACMQERTHQQMLNRFEFPDGGAGWFDLRISPVPDGILVLSVDVTEQRALHERLARREADLAATLQCMGEALIATDPEGRVTAWNEAAAALTGWPAESALSQPLPTLLEFRAESSGATTPLAVLEAMRRGERLRWSNHTLAVGRAARTSPVATSATPIVTPDGVLRGAVMVLRDLTREHELQRRLRETQRLEAAGRLAAGVAHDFNNVLTAIQGFAGLALAGLAPEHPARADVAGVLDAAERGTAISRQLLALARRTPARPEVFEVGAALRALLPLLRRAAGDGVEVRWQPPAGPRFVRLAPASLDQVVLNLAVNARDAMPSGGTVTVAALDGAGDPPTVLIEVRDTGTGMPPEVAARATEPFFSTKGERGTGLGLSICAEIAAAAGGTLSIETAPGRGTTVRVSLPRCLSPAGAGGAAPVRRPSWSHEGRALVVDDDAALRALVARLLRERGMRVAEARSAEEALARFDADTGVDTTADVDAAGPPALVVTDLQLVGASGLDLLASLRGRHPDVPVLLVSGLAPDDDEPRLRWPGVAFLAKPFTPAQLTAAAVRLLAPVAR